MTPTRRIGSSPTRLGRRQVWGVPDKTLGQVLPIARLKYAGRQVHSVEPHRLAQSVASWQALGLGRPPAFLVRRGRVRRQLAAMRQLSAKRVPICSPSSRTWFE